MKTASRLLSICALLVIVAGCSYFQFPGVHKISIQQGHIITQDMIDQLEPGMTKQQVRYVLGTPLLPATFDNDRWDYYYSLRRGRDGRFFQRHMTVYFDDGVMTRFEGDFEPTEVGDAPVTGEVDVELDDPEDEPIDPSLEAPDAGPAPAPAPQPDAEAPVPTPDQL